MKRMPLATTLTAIAIVFSVTGCADFSGQPLPHSTTDVSGEVLRYWDGVGFTHIEAQSVLGFVNDATLQQLDDEVGLDIRAARSIVKARPISNMGHLSHLFFVGEVALRKLKAAVQLKVDFDHSA